MDESEKKWKRASILMLKWIRRLRSRASKIWTAIGDFFAKAARFVRKNRTSFAWLGGVALLISGFLAIILYPEVQADRLIGGQEVTVAERSQIVNDYRRTLVQALGALAVLGGLLLTLRRIKASEDANRINEEANRETSRVTEEGQVTDRFTRAIEQLGSEEMAIRLGGIYSLERIARDSDKDHWTVMEVLSAFLRQEAATEEANAEYELQPYGRNPRRGFVTRTDVQAALTVIGRRMERDESGRIDLHGIWIREYELEDLNFTRARLWDAHLENAFMQNVELRHALLIRSSFDDANLKSVSLEGANCYRASFKNAHLENATISDCEMAEANLDGAVLFDAKLENVSFMEATLRAANFQRAELNDCHFHQAKLEGANFSNSRFHSSSFVKANLIGVRFNFANFEDCRFIHSDLHRAIFFHAQISSEALKGTDCPPNTFRNAIVDGISFDESMPDPRTPEWVRFVQEAQS